MYSSGAKRLGNEENRFILGLGNLTGKGLGESDCALSWSEMHPQSAEKGALRFRFQGVFHSRWFFETQSIGT